MALSESHLEQLDRIMARTIGRNLEAGMSDQEALRTAVERMFDLTPKTAAVWMNRHAS